MKQKYIVMALSIAVVGLFFQNCSGVGTASSGSGATNSSNSSFGSSSSERYIAADNTVQGGVVNPGMDTSTTGSSMKVVVYATPAAQNDCSSPDAVISSEVQNAGSDIRVCPEYILDMPAGSARAGEKYHCDSDDKFVKPPTSWVYDSAASRWQVPTEKLTNHAYLVPGSYWIKVKDSQGRVSVSNAMVIKRAKATNCLVQSSINSGGSGGSPAAGSGSNSQPSPTPVRSCNWSGGIVIGPTPNYAVAHGRSCVVGNETYTYTENGTVYNYSCVCRN